MSIATLPTGKDDSDRERVAAEVRGLLAKRKIPVYKLSEYLDSGESRGYWQRRVSGDTAFDIDDLSRLAGLLQVSIVELVSTTKKPTPHGPGGGSTLHGVGTLIERRIVGRTGLEPVTDGSWVAPVTPMFGSVAR